MGVYFFLLVQQLIAGGTHIVAKAIVGDIEPVTLTLLRSTLTAALLMAFLLLKRPHWRIERIDYLKLLWLSLLAVPVNQFLFFHGISRTTASNSALLFATTPVVVLVLSNLILREKLTWRKVLGVAVAVAGVSAVIFEHGFALDSGATYGNLVLLVSVISWAFLTIHGKPMVMKYGAPCITVFTLIIGMFLYLPVALHLGIHISLSSFSLMHWQGLLYFVVGTSIFSKLLWYLALARIDASKVAVFANIQPFVTTILAVILLGQEVTATFVVGGFVTIAGVVLVQFG
jgi:drug/metabolite transporter (DMT)-like permease